MSTITNFAVYSHRNDLGGKVWNPAIKWTNKYAVFVLLEDDTGLSGIGECWCFDTVPDTLVTFLRTEVAPHVVGASVEFLPEIFTQLTSRATLTARHGLLASAISGVDIAAWDIRSQAAKLPLWAYLQDYLESSNLRSTGEAQLYGSGGLYGQNKSLNDLCLEMSGMVKTGFNLVKMKVGGLSIADDSERVHAVLNELDNACKLIIDGVYSYTPAQALELYGLLPADRIAAFQSPVKAADLSGMASLCVQGLPVMGTEAEYREELHQQIINTECVRYLQTAPIACGGFTRLIELHQQIHQSGNSQVQLSLEVSSTAIALMAATHFAAASDLVAHAEYHFVHQVFFDRLEIESVDRTLGMFRLPRKPGLGIELPLAQVNHEFSVANRLHS